MKKKVSLIFLSIILAISSVSFAESNKLQANIASVDITPPLEMKYTLGGYGERENRPAEGIHDHIWAKALIVKDNEKKYAIVTLDILGLPPNVKTDLLKRISNNGWSKENIMLLPSHSHGSLEMAALNSKNNLGIPQIGIFQPELLEFVLDKLEVLINTADQNFKPVKIGTQSKMLENANHNRRGDPEVDRELTITRVDKLDGKPLAVLVNWTAHPTFIDGKDMLVSAEWPGYLQSDLQNLIGSDVTVMYYNGAEGDQSPVLNGAGMNDYEKIQEYGKKIAKEAFQVYRQIKPKANNILSFNYETVQLPKRRVHPDFMKTGGAEYGLTKEKVKYVLDALAPPSAGVAAVRIGNLIIAGIPGEMAAGLGMKIKQSVENNGIEHVTIGGLANEWISYILTAKQYSNGAGYESSVSFYGPGLGKIISENAIKTAIALEQPK